jgi:hypothetical protein
MQHAANGFQVGDVEQGVFELALRERAPPPIGPRFVLGNVFANQPGREGAVGSRIFESDQARGELDIEPLRRPLA